MKLSRLYSNETQIFSPIRFNDGLSAILAEIRVPENRLLDTHNLGKTTVGELIDFCLLKGKNATFFLFKHERRFNKFAFYLELAMPDGSYLTIGRRVDPGSRVSFKRTRESFAGGATLDAEEWDHYDVPFDRAKLLLDGALDIDVLKPWGFRQLVGYLIRSQQDYRDVFQLGKFSGKHQEWKPFVAHLMGLPAQPVIDLYARRAELENATARLQALTENLGGKEVDVPLLDGLIAVKRRDVEEKQATLDSFNFGEDDRRTIEDVVDRTEAMIAGLTEEAYQLDQLIHQIEESLKTRAALFRPTDAAKLFAEAGVVFGEQITKDFDQLIAFNRAITDERDVALQTQLDDARARRHTVDADLAPLHAQRAESLAYLRESDALAKYKDLSRLLTKLQAELATLGARREAATQVTELRRERRALAEAYGQLQTVVEAEVEQISQDEESRFGRLRRYFTEIIFEVLGENAVLAMNVNNQGGIDFHAEFIGESGTATSGDRGTSYKKLLCIAFDLAILRAHLEVRFPRFVYLDGALEQLEPRKREKLLGVFREYATLGIQPVISLLDSDLPEPLDAGPATLSGVDVVLILHDEGADGRLFKMDAW